MRQKITDNGAASYSYPKSYFFGDLQPHKIPLAPMGVLAPRSVHAITSAQPPIDTSGNFSAHMSWRGGQKMLAPDIFDPHKMLIPQIC